MNGGSGRNRTSDTRIFSPLLYRLSYLGILIIKIKNCGSRIWTNDLRVMSPTSYQTAPSRDMKLNKMAEVEGFEPPRDFHPLSVFKTDPFSRTWVNLRNIMVELSGIEPLTSCLQSRRSPSWAKAPLQWSGRQDSNLRPPGPKPGALPSCATSRKKWRARQESNPQPLDP